MKPVVFISAVLVFLLAGCSKDLQQANPNQQTAQTFWKTATDAFDAGNSVYGSLILDGSYMRFTHVILNTRGDDATSNSPWNEIYNCGKFAEDVNGFAAQAPFTAYYQGVFRANQVLEYVPPISMDTALKNRILGQAYFLRGLYYFHLASIYKNVPMPLTVAQSSAGYYVRQTSQDSVYQQVISDFQKAATLLPVSYANVTGPDQGQVGRATAGAAVAYLGKTYLFTKQWALAAQQFQAVMNLGIYSLTPNYHDNFTEQDENNQESIFEVQFSRTVGGTADGWGPGDPDPTWGKYEARAVTFGPRNFAYGDVQPTKALYYEFLQEKTVDSAVDPRLYATMFYNTPTMTVYGQSFQAVYGVADSEVFCRKYENDGFYPNEFTPAAFQSGINSRLMRYADVLLMYAECLNEQGQTSQAYPYIQQVRVRVNLPDLATVMPNMTQQEMRDQLAHERYLEFGLEGHRFDDIVRWGWLQDPAKLAWLQARDPEFLSYFPGREYMPIPLAEIQANPGVVQNPGW
jgi:starch-binding outer membrane protein, SusD/RagB family